MRRPESGLGHVLGSRAVRLLVSAVLAGAVPIAVAQRDETARNGQMDRGISAHIAGGFAGHALVPLNGNSSGVTPDRNRRHHRVRHHSRSSGHSYRFHPAHKVLEAVMPRGSGYVGSSAYGVKNAVSLAASQYTESVQPQHDDHQPAFGLIAADYEPAPPAESAASPAGLGAEPELELIFRDGHQRSIRNYVLTGKTLIVLDNAASGRQQRIPLVDLDLPATEHAAEAAGLEFIPPA